MILCKQCTRFGAHHPEALRLLRRYKKHCHAKKKLYSRSAVDSIVLTAKRNPRMFWRHMPSSRSTPQLPSAGDPTECTRFFSGLFNKHAADEAPALPPGGQHDEPDLVLNEHVTEHEVGVVLRALRTACSSGTDGVPAEFFKYAVRRDRSGGVESYLLAPYLAQLFDWCFQQGTAPDDWGLALLTMIHKGGNTTDWGNYRPIAVVQVISKMYAMVLSNRLHGWAEAQGDTVRKPSQAGFRPVYNTTFNTFTLNHFINKSKANKRALYTCFVDLEKAYDSTPRDKLWHRLHHLGVRGRMLFAIAALYKNVQYQVKFTNGLSEAFGGDTGVRQGCPLSPFLFGVFVEMLHERIHTQHPTEGPTFDYSDPVHVPLLLFADDIALLSYTPQGLQRLLHCLADFCDENHLTVSMRKTKVVVFHKALSQVRQGQQFTVQGKLVAVEDEYKYLGLMFGTGRVLLSTKLEKAAARRGTAALAAVYGLFHSLHIQSNPYLKMKLFKAVVQPNLLYACEIWGTKLLALDPRKPFQSQVDGVSTPFYRNLLSLKSSTSTWCLHREVGMYPWQLSCFRQMLRFVNKLRHMPDTTLARMALCDAIADHRDYQHNNWFAQLMSFCDKIQAPVLLDLDGVHTTIPSFNEAQCIARLKEMYYSVFTSAGSDHPKMQKYHTCFASHLPPIHKQWDAQPYLRTGLNTRKASFIARFRLSSHHMACETGTWRRRNGAAGANPIRCPWCSTEDRVVVQDEPHVFFSCQHFQHLRAQKPLLFGMDRESSLWRFFNEYDVTYEDIAWFLKETKLIYT
jgi:Reverse transcriptase (RNA-dependent DNA polymerase)